ncbi:MAG TPA: acyltransferase [Mycobacteriales bacterium]|nr:acyltransferase [Mycobacteriales bacterium]
MTGRISAAVRRRRDRRAARLQWRRTVDALQPPPPRAFAGWGVNTIIVPPARVECPDCIALGSEVILHEHAWLCVQRRDGLPAPSLTIGDRTSINRFAKIVCHGRVTIGADALIGDRVYISDVQHLPWRGEERAHPLTEPRPVTIGDRAFLGIAVVIKPGVTIGDDAYVGAGAVVHDDVPPSGVVVGDPARLVRLRNPQTGEWEPV